MTLDEHAKEQSQERTNVRRLILRRESSLPRGEQLTGTQSIQSSVADNDDDPGPSAA
jgi:hypothetical protein